MERSVAGELQMAPPVAQELEWPMIATLDGAPAPFVFSPRARHLLIQDLWGAFWWRRWEHEFERLTPWLLRPK